MATHPSPSARLAFGPFEVNAEADELLKNGTRIRLPGQPFQILLLLLAHPSRVVTREQLHEQIWSDGTFVDFEHGLNAAMNKLRRALGDSADNPRYIETLPGRGYRFIGAVEHRLSAPVSSDITLVPGHPLPSEPSPASKHRHLSPAKAWVLLGVSIVALGIWGATRLLTPHPTNVAQPVLQFAVSQPPGAIFAAPISRQPFAISPDGARLAFTATDAKGSRIWIRDLAASEIRSVPGTEGAWTVFWSPDSRSIFYSVRKNVMQANLDTGSSRTVATTPVMTMYGAWRSKDDLFLYVGPHSFYEVNVQTGSVRELQGASMRWAQFLPGSDHFLHVAYDAALGRFQAMATDYASGRSTPLLETDSRVEYAPPLHSGEPGYLLFLHAGTLLAQPFDADHLRLMGEPFPLAQKIVYYGASASGCFSVSNNGVLVYQSGFPLSELRWYDRAGHIVSATRAALFTGTVRISPDGHQVAADIWSPDAGGRDVWLFEQGGRESRRLTYPPAHHDRPIWSPDGSRLAFGASMTGAPRLTSLNANEGGKERPFLNEAASQPPANQIQIPTDWSRDGRYIVYDTSLGEEEREVWLFEVASGKLTPLLKNGSSQWGAAFSPDGRSVGFVSEQSGRPEVYVQPFESSPTPHLAGERRQISRDGAWLVRWRPDGHELFYVGVDAQLYAVRIEHGSTVGEPKALFPIPGNPQYGTATDVQFDVEPGGQRFVVTTAAAATAPDFTVIQNWQAKFRH